MAPLILLATLLLLCVLRPMGIAASPLPYGGWGNNLDSVHFGVAGGNLMRRLNPEYDDLVSSPKQLGMPSAREVSNGLFAGGPGPRDWNVSHSATPVNQLFVAFVELLRADLVDLDRKVHI
jgi:hypothetical protein